MPLVRFDDFLIGEIQVGPQSFKFDVLHKKQLPLFVDAPLRNPHDPAKDDGSLNLVGIPVA
ncbi:MAG: hypothetical protein HXX11_12700 [Desulfuromonadales bacterium]|nr:hypothetical protein [Desulfuromonadales bacterium]